MRLEADIFGLLTMLGMTLSIGMGVFFIGQRRKNSTFFFLGLIEIFGALSLLSTLLTTTNLFELCPFLISVMYPVFFFLGSVSFFYACALTEKNFTLKKRHWPLYFVPVAGFLLCLPLFILSDHEKRLLIETIQSQRNLTPYLWFLMIVSILYNWIILFLEYRKIRWYRKALQVEFSNLNKIDLSFLIKELFMFVICWVIVGLLSFFSFNRIIVEFSIKLSGFLPVLFLLFFGYSGLTNLFKTMPQEAGLKQESEHIAVSEAESEKYEILKEELRLNRYFLDPDLTLPVLAEKISFYRNELSEVINRGSGLNFFHFINNYRIEHFKELALTADFRQRTILELAYESGFNSKASFYNAFRRITGQTPGQFLKS